MIGVSCRPDQRPAVEEFFELFKTSWEFCRAEREYDVVLATTDAVTNASAKLLVAFGASNQSIDERLGVALAGQHSQATLRVADRDLYVYCGVSDVHSAQGAPLAFRGTETAGAKFQTETATVLRLGYDLFDEVRFLLTTGQPIEKGLSPTLDLHIDLLRQWMQDAGISFVEIPAVPAGYPFIACLTHDIDFVAVRDHKFDHSILGFAYRATVGSVVRFARGRMSLRNVLRNWAAVLSVPFVYAGWLPDFWEPFAWYLEVEDGIPATYFLIPFKKRAGERVPGAAASRRAAGYDVRDLKQSLEKLRSAGCEIGVHGLDAWHSVEKGKEEQARIEAASGAQPAGVRMHWLLRDENTYSTLDDAGFTYDSTCGYNETPGYRSGTSQVFRPLGVRHLLELPMHIQDGALFYPQRLDLSDSAAETICKRMIDHVNGAGGVLTVLWHDRSHAPERFWGGFYVKLVRSLRDANAWFGSGAQVVEWFAQRRKVRFDDRQGDVILVRDQESRIDPPLRVRIHTTDADGSSKFVEFAWDGSKPFAAGHSPIAVGA